MVGVYLAMPKFKTIITNVEKLKMIVSTDNFHPDTDPKLLCTCGHPDCDKRSVNQKTLDKGQVVRSSVNRGLAVTSGGRCPHHKDELKRKHPADHQKQQGLDVACNGGVERGQLVDEGIKAGFNAIGIAKGFVHLGVREELPEGVIIMWVY